VDAAMALARRRGDYRKFSMRELARYMSMSPTGLYQVFPAKSEIERAVRLRVLADVQSDLVAEGIDEDPALALTAWLERFARIGRADALRRSCLIEASPPTESEPHNRAAAAELLAVLEGAREANRLREGLTPLLALRLVLIFANGLLVLRSSDDPEDNEARAVGPAIAGFVGGIVERRPARLRVPPLRHSDADSLPCAP
jgi:AcrR family transcriptional regulator